MNSEFGCFLYKTTRQERIVLIVSASYMRNLRTLRNAARGKSTRNLQTSVCSSRQANYTLSAAANASIYNFIAEHCATAACNLAIGTTVQKYISPPSQNPSPLLLKLVTCNFQRLDMKLEARDITTIFCFS